MLLVVLGSLPLYIFTFAIPGWSSVAVGREQRQRGDTDMSVQISAQWCLDIFDLTGYICRRNCGEAHRTSGSACWVKLHPR